MDVPTIWILILAVAATATAGVVGFAIGLRQVKRTRRENERLRREIAALREDLTNYQTLMSAVQPAPGARIEPVFTQEQLRLESAARKEGPAQDGRRTRVTSRPAPKESKAELPQIRRLYIVEAAIVILGGLVLVLAAIAIIYRLSD